MKTETELLNITNNDDTKKDNERLCEIILEERKENKKMSNKMEKEIITFKSEKMETLEKLRCTVLERERFRENERVLLNTFDMMKKCVDSKLPSNEDKEYLKKHVA